MLHPLSGSPTIPPPSPAIAPHTAPLSPPAPLPAFSDNAPAGSHAGLTLHTSASLLHTPLPPHPVFSLPAPQTTPAHIPTGRPLLSRSTLPPAAAVLPRSATAARQSISPSLPPLLPATSDSALSIAPSSPHQTDHCCT